jgi:hypothetical protein
MARFGLHPVRFGPRPDEDEDDNGEGLPRPTKIKLAARRAAGIAEAKAALAHLPKPGESLHAICTARMDLTDIIGGLIEKVGPVPIMMIATLGYNHANLATMLRWLDSGAVTSLSLVASIFFRAHKGALWDETLREFRARKQRATCCHSHAKVVTMAFASGETFSIEGSANLCGNGSGREQFALINDRALHDWHAAWISELVTRHEGKEAQGKEAEAHKGNRGTKAQAHKGNRTAPR